MENGEKSHVEQTAKACSAEDVEKDVTAKQLTEHDTPSKPPAVPEHEYITGVKLLLILTSVTLVAFLMMLDMSIIATVGFIPIQLSIYEYFTNAAGYTSDHQRFPLAV
jgi:hypothetical protein